MKHLEDILKEWKASKRDIQQFLTYFTKIFINEVSYNIQFLTQRGEDVWWFDGERVKFRSATTAGC